jgi:hypothetical protein
VHLRLGERGMAVGGTFFRPLGDRTRAVISQFSPGEQEVVRRFLTGVTDAVEAHRRTMRG